MWDQFNEWSNMSSFNLWFKWLHQNSQHIQIILIVLDESPLDINAVLFINGLTIKHYDIPISIICSLCLVLISRW